MSKARIVFTIVVATLLAVPCLAQQNVAPDVPRSSPDTPAAAQKQQPGSGTSAVLKIKTRLVIVDVVARDSKGVPVSDLKQEDFKILEDGKEQAVRIFNFQHPDSSPATQSPALSASNVVDNLPHFRSGKALNIILLDVLNTSRASQAFMRDEMIKFLDKLPENEPIAVYLLSDKLRLLQDFTADPTLLKQVVHSFKGKGSPYLSVAADGTAI